MVLGMFIEMSFKYTKGVFKTTCIDVFYTCSWTKVRLQRPLRLFSRPRVIKPFSRPTEESFKVIVFGEELVNAFKV